MLAFAAINIFAVSCSDDDEARAILGSQTQTAEVLIVHASPDAPGVDIFVDNQGPAVSNLTFPANTGYVALDAGTRNVKVNVTNTSTTVIDANVKLDPNAAYTVFAVNSVANIEPLVLVDDLSSPAAGKAHVRFVHLSPDAPAVDVGLAGNGAVVFGNVSFKGFDGFTPLDAGTYDLEVRLAGTATAVLPLPGIMLESGKIYTVFAKGFVSGSGAQALGAEIIVNK
ncbi:MAG: DUF4397 domain-containing protein [Candidatus Zixiibacteriota bacterium]|nr:MAG: DUF4397 domain-containing protein [candidate division Zixibacteria bacterium]